MKRPLFALSIFLAAGIFSASFVPLGFSWILWVIGLLAFPLFFLLQKSSSKTFQVYLLFFLLGFFLYDSSVTPSSQRVDQFDSLNQEISLHGKVLGQIKISEKVQWIVKASEIQAAKGQWLKAQGKVLVKEKGKDFLKFENGAGVHVVGKLIGLPLLFPNGTESFSMWLRTQEIAMVLDGNLEPFSGLGPSLWERFLNCIKFWCSEKLSLGLDEAPLSQNLLRAMVLGDREDLDFFVKASFLYTNTVHILSISGLHLGVILMAVMFVLGLFSFSKRWVMGITLIVIWIYAVMTGLSYPVFRSVIMATFFLAGHLFRKKNDLANSLGASLLFILILHPLSIFDQGFQLSFLCMGALIFLTPRLEKDLEFLGGLPIQAIHLLPSKKERFFAKSRHWVLKIVSGSLAVWLGVLPVVAYHFQIFSPVTILANLLVVPWVGLSMNLGFASCLLGFIPGVSLSLNSVNGILLNILIFLMDFLSRIPGACFFIHQPSKLWFLFYYGVIALGFLKAQGKIKFFYFLLVALSLVAFLFQVPDKKCLRLQLVNRNDFKAQMIQWPNGSGALWIKDSLSSSDQKDQGKVEWVGRLPFIFKTRDIQNIFFNQEFWPHSETFLQAFPQAKLNPSMEEVEENIKEVKNLFPDKKNLDEFEFHDIWFQWINTKEVLQSFFERPEGKGVLILSDGPYDLESFLKILDRGKILAVVYDESLDKDLMEALRERGISSYSISKGEPLILETDGKSLFIVQ
ncbi:MAG: ComEC/Rec2 family competence protein [Chlamydiae bacterium]|nr:ComEC/Rec2 family competence protein [Chlamydiota bacterium]MBI3277385.1 ComEC/Rec2 family competence protein [Chlamydiota bacterium]